MRHDLYIADVIIPVGKSLILPNSGIEFNVSVSSWSTA